MKSTKSNDQKVVETLGESLRRRKLSQTEVEGAMNRVWQDLEPKAGAVPEDVLRDLQPSGSPSSVVWRPVWIVAAAALVLAIGLSYMVRNSPAAAVLHSGALARVSGDELQFVPLGRPVGFGEVVRASGSGPAVLTLTDASQIEMRAQSQLSLEQATDGTRIRLTRGSLIVSASPQGSGHLYVQTRDVSISVAGTVFLVNAEESGSRVAVLEGRVQVQQGTVSKVLLPGEEIATAPAMKARPVIEEIHWSANSAAHALLLAQSRVEPPPAPPVRLVFAAASVKIDTDFETGAMDGEQGLACHGQDGLWRASLPFSTNLFTAPRGRCVGRRVALADLIAAAYSSTASRVVGIPPQGLDGNLLRYGLQVNATADNPATATTEQLKVMLQNLLADRFGLKVHRELRNTAGCVLTIAKNGLKIQMSSDEPETPHIVPADRARMIRGRSSMAQLADFLARPRNAVDKTGLSGIYEYTLVLDMSLLPGASKKGGAPVYVQDISCEAGVVNGPQVNVSQYVPPLATALEQQLGLTLKSETVPAELVVVEEVRNPSEN